MKKNIAGTIISALVIALLVWIASRVLSFSYIEWSFFIGAGIAIIAFIFNSRGGTLSKGTAMDASEANWKIEKGNELEAEVGFVFYGAVLFTLISFLIMLFFLNK